MQHDHQKRADFAMSPTSPRGGICRAASPTGFQAGEEILLQETPCDAAISRMDEIILALENMLIDEKFVALQNKWLLENLGRYKTLAMCDYSKFLFDYRSSVGQSVSKIIESVNPSTTLSSVYLCLQREKHATAASEVLEVLSCFFEADSLKDLFSCHEDAVAGKFKDLGQFITLNGKKC